MLVWQVSLRIGGARRVLVPVLVCFALNCPSLLLCMARDVYEGRSHLGLPTKWSTLDTSSCSRQKVGARCLRSEALPSHTQCISMEAIFGGTMFLNMFESKMFMKQISFGTKPKPGVQWQRMSDDDDSCSSSQIWGSRDIPKSHLALTQHTRPSVPSPTYGGQKISMLWNLSTMFWIL